MKKEENRFNFNRKSVTLGILSALLIVALFLPWGKGTFKYQTGGVLGKIHFSFNGFGKGEISCHFVEGEKNKKGKEHFSLSLLSQSSTIAIAVVIINSLIGFAQADGKVLPKKVRKVFDKHWAKILFLEGITLIGMFLTFITLYLNNLLIPVPTELSSELGSGRKTITKLYNLMYTHREEVMRELGIGEMPMHKNVGIGSGAFLLLAVGMGHVYTSFIHLMRKEKWSEAWQKTATVFPLMVLGTLFPVARFLAKRVGGILLMIEISETPVLNGYAGPLYLCSTIVLLYLARRGALLERRLTSTVQELYAAGETKGEKEEKEEKVTLIQKLRERRSLINTLISIFLILTIVLAFSLIYGLVMEYQAFITNNARSYMHSTILAPIALFTPFIMVALRIIYRF